MKQADKGQLEPHSKARKLYENGYKAHWTPNALDELSQTIEYLEKNLTDREISRLALKIEEIIASISHNPQLFRKAERRNIYIASLF